MFLMLKVCMCVCNRRNINVGTKNLHKICVILSPFVSEQLGIVGRGTQWNLGFCAY